MPTGCFFRRWLSVALLMLACFACMAAEPPFRVERQGELLELHDLKTGKLIADRVQGLMWMDSYWRFSRDGHDGVIDNTGRVVVPADYDEISRSVSAPFYIVGRDGKYGVIDLEGRVRVPLEYDDIVEYSKEGRPWVVRRDGKEGLMDPADQHLLLAARYESILQRGAFALATNPEAADGPRYQAFDLHGRPVPGAESDEEIEALGQDRLILDGERVIGPDGEVVVASGRYASISRSSETRAIVFDKNRGKAGVIDRDGRLVVPLEWDYIESLSAFYPGWMRVVTGGRPHAGGKVGVIDIQGRIILQPRWDGVELRGARSETPFFQAERDGKTWFLDMHDKPLFAQPFDAVHPIDREGRYRVERGGKSGLCTNVALARCPIPVEYDQLYEFDQAPSGLWVVQKDGRLGVLQQTDGHVVVPLAYDFLQMSPESTGLPPPGGRIDEVKVVASRKPLNGTLVLRVDERGNWRMTGEDLDRRPADWQVQAALAACPALPAFDPAQAESELQALMARWRASLPERASTAFGLPWPALADSVANQSRARSFVEALFVQPWRLVGEPRGANVREPGELFAEIMEQAIPVRSGGRYPETVPEFAGLCAEVWYLRIQMLEQAVELLGETSPLAEGYALPPAGTLQRNVYPFITVVRTPHGLRLAGVSSELAQVLNWYYARIPAATGDVAADPE